MELSSPTHVLVSIISASFNSSKYIKDTYLSLVSQTHTNWEWLVTDDCSSDNTFDILVGIAKDDQRVKPTKNNENFGAAFSRNVSIAKAQGKFLAFIDSDDLWKPDKLQKQLVFMGDNINFSFTPYEVIRDDGTSTKKFVDLSLTGTFTYEDMLCKAATLGCSTVMLRRIKYPNLMMPLIRTGQDYALWLKLLKEESPAHILPAPLSLYRITPNSISRNKFKKALRQWEIYRNIEHLSIPTALRCFIYYAWRAIFRK